ncbi:MAG: hypothetical protein ABGY95_09040, partial [Rubritalea sp.]|uniref:hypothetical protein n=1 Tax=Rubritalea sp. TaxID=2109375 RepID=UPI00324262B3
ACSLTLAENMKTDKEHSFPWWVIPLMLLASFSYESHSEDGSSLSFNGTGSALLVIGIVSLVMVFQVTKRIQAALKAHKLIDRIPRSRFWPLLPFSIIFPAIGYRAISESGFKSKFTDEYLHHWDFRWGGADLHIWLIVGVLVIIFLHTVILTLAEIERTAKNS